MEKEVYLVTMKLLIESTQRPAIFTGPDGRSYIVGGTVKSVDGTPVKSGVVRLEGPFTVDDLEWKRPVERITKPLELPTVVEVKGSKPGIVYRVTMIGKRAVSCTCPGYTYRRFCKHIGTK